MAKRELPFTTGADRKAKVSSEAHERISDEDVRRLLVRHERVRDPVQGDIEITALERAVIDTSAFQRLRLLNQLGPTHLVYPGAVHTRFVHSLGALHWAEKLISVVNSNYSVYSHDSQASRTLMAIDPYPHLLVRLCALLHDVAHIPFGHTLEDEGNLANPEWEDTSRATQWLGDGQEIPCAIENFVTGGDISPEAAKQLVADVQKYVRFKGDPMTLEYPFVQDLVGNTICADLLDYLDRDMYFCGLRERTGDRVVNYLAIVKASQTTEQKGHGELSPAEDGKGRVVLLTYRFEPGHVLRESLRVVPQTEIVSEAIDLLRRRFTLAQKVYFHRTKLAASAMLISAMGSSSVTLNEMYALSDVEFIVRLSSDKNARTKYLAEAYQKRRLYKRFYRIKYLEERDTEASSKKLWTEGYPKFRKPAWRRSIEHQLETYASLPSGSVAIYCPDREMNLKEFEVLVQSLPRGEIKKLERILDPGRRLEMEAINYRFPFLWSFLVFVDPAAIDVSLIENEAVQDLNKLCEDLIGFPNDEIELQGKGRPLKEQIVERAISEWDREGSGKSVPHSVYNQVVHASYRGEADMLEAARKHLRAVMEDK